MVEEGEEDENLIEANYTNGNNEVVKIFNRKCVESYERESVYAFRQCGHQFVIVSNVIKIKVILIFKNVLFVEHKNTIENVRFFPI